MPHLVLEYSDNIKEKESFKLLFVQLHQILVTVCSATLESCQSRAIPWEIYYIGDGNSKNAFVHLEVCLAEGRPLEVRKAAGRQMLGVCGEYFSKSLRDLNLQITVELREFRRDLYFKIPEGTV
jgi:5-carboxymethyl-2-hydroxymuconate isomerase